MKPCSNYFCVIVRELLICPHSGSVKFITFTSMIIFAPDTFTINLLSFCLLYSTATANLTRAQEFGGNPPSIKWNQINTPAAKVIFPRGIGFGRLWGWPILFSK